MCAWHPSTPGGMQRCHCCRKAEGKINIRLLYTSQYLVPLMGQDSTKATLHLTNASHHSSCCASPLLLLLSFAARTSSVPWDSPHGLSSCSGSGPFSFRDSPCLLAGVSLKNVLLQPPTVKSMLDLLGSIIAVDTRFLRSKLRMHKITFQFLLIGF